MTIFLEWAKWSKNSLISLFTWSYDLGSNTTGASSSSTGADAWTFGAEAGGGTFAPPLAGGACLPPAFGAAFAANSS